MGTVILLSSSPPRPFAHSPTPATSSSPAFASPSSIFGNGHKRFKTAAVERDGFAGGFSSARYILGTKVGSENIPFGVTRVQQISRKPAKDLSLKTTSAGFKLEDGGRSNAKHTESLATAELLVDDPGIKEPVPLVAPNGPVGAAVEDVFITEADARPKDQACCPLLLDKALSRRLDWTPPRRHFANVVGPDPEASPSRASFPGGLLESFEFEGGTAQSSFNIRSNDEAVPTKRRKLELIDHGSRKASNITAVPKPAAETRISGHASMKRNKSQKKRITTITGLATSKYFGEDQTEGGARPMLEFLATTQARDIGDTEVPSPDTTKRKRAPKKPAKAKKKSLPKSILLSPESAMKAFDSQGMVFGSASQLVRDESPTFIRDTVEATKQSESSIIFTPIPTQVTIPSEPGSVTPRGLKGTSRFTMSRNLWASASRDEDNALLQVETIDLLDSPDLRLAFTGKDAMLEPTVPRHRESISPEKGLPLLRGGHVGRSAFTKSKGWLDIDDISILTPGAHVMTKPFTQTRTIHIASEPLGKRAESPLHTSEARREGAKGNSLADEEEVPMDTSVYVGASHSTEPLEPQMPLFSGFTTGELSNQTKKYGFKPIKKREKMIEVLQSCWEAKHKLNAHRTSKMAAENVQDEEVEVATHGDILSKVHGLATRPVPKVPKPKVPKAKKDESQTPAKPARRKAAAKAVEDVEGTPKPRKKVKPRTTKPVESTVEEVKVPRKRKVKATALSEEFVIDISDIEDSMIKGRHKAPIPIFKTGAQDVRDTVLQSATRLAAPPPTLPPRTSFEPESSTPRSVENATPDLPDINSQITDAVTKYVASPTRDHQRDPTWHEKILMYDPIVLEDLAAWLNTEGFGLIGEDREVSALEVRTWCEMKGVCCYGVGGGWRGNVKGRAKARGSEVED